MIEFFAVELGLAIGRDTELKLDIVDLVDRTRVGAVLHARPQFAGKCIVMCRLRSTRKVAGRITKK